MGAVSGSLTDTASVQREGLCAPLTRARTAPRGVSMVLGHPSHLWGEASWHLSDLESGRNDVVCVRLEAWTHLPHHLPPSATSAWSKNQWWLRGCQFPLSAGSIPIPVLDQLIAQVPRQHCQMRGCQSRAAHPMGILHCQSHPCPAPHTPALLSAPKTPGISPQPLTHGGATVGPSLLLDLGSTKARENAGWKNIKWIFFLSSF